MMWSINGSIMFYFPHHEYILMYKLYVHNYYHEDLEYEHTCNVVICPQWLHFRHSCSVKLWSYHFKQSSIPVIVDMLGISFKSNLCPSYFKLETYTQLSNFILVFFFKTSTKFFVSKSLKFL